MSDEPFDRLGTPGLVWVPFQVDAKFHNYRVDRFLAQRLAAYSRNRIQKILVEARVLRGERILKTSARVRGGERILIAYPRREEAPLAPDAFLPVLYEDESLLVIDKPAHLLSHPTDKIQRHTVLGLLRHCRPEVKKIHLLHRLDRETSGVLALAKTPAAARLWGRMMEQREIKKTYLALVAGMPARRKGVIDWPIGRQGGEVRVRQWVNVPGAVDAVTEYEVMADRGRHTAGDSPDVWRAPFSVIRAAPETGRLHQIRVHLAALGHPLLGDVLYNGDGSLYLNMIGGRITPEERAALGFPRLALHAARIVFRHPLSGKTLRVDAPLPADFRDFLALRGITKIDTLTAS